MGQKRIGDCFEDFGVGGWIITNCLQSKKGGCMWSEFILLMTEACENGSKPFVSITRLAGDILVQILCSTD